MFIPKQVAFWGKFGIKFVAVFIGENIPSELAKYETNIILWNRNLNINTTFVGQNMRIYYPALLNLPEDEMVMITDMDMLPMSASYYKDNLENYTIDDFIYYRNIDGNQIYMCYNAAHPKTWANLFNITCENDIEKILQQKYEGAGWYTDQLTMYEKLINYPNLKVLNKPIRRMESWDYATHLKNNDVDFIKIYDDAHFHQNYYNNEMFILDAERQLITKQKSK